MISRTFLITLLVLLPLLFSPAWGQPSEQEAAYFQNEEALLLDFDINNPQNTLSLLGDLDGTSMILKVADPAGRTIGVFKPTSGNTLHVSEIVAYRLCRRLGLPVCTPTIHKTLSGATLQRFADILEQHTYQAPENSRHTGHFKSKERFRKALIARLRTADVLPGVLKTWVTPLILYEGLGRIPSVKKHPLYPYMRHDGPEVLDETFTIRQCTKIYKPAGCYSADIGYYDLLEQFTGILIVDAIIGNNDRFSGGNVHLFSLESRYIQLRENRYRLPSASLLMLDNGSGFMRGPSRALNVIRKKLKITRFARAQFRALNALWEDYRANRERVMLELGLVERYTHGRRVYSPTKVFEKNLPRLIRYMESLEETYGTDAWN